MPFMTLSAKRMGSRKLTRVSEAEELVTTTLAEVTNEGSLGYQAELMLRLAFGGVEAEADGASLRSDGASVGRLCNARTRIGYGLMLRGWRYR